MVVSLVAARIATNEAASKAVLSALSNPLKVLVVLFKAALITLKLPVVIVRKLPMVLMYGVRLPFWLIVGVFMELGAAFSSVKSLPIKHRQ
jgi:hypothetical protein